MGNGIKNISVSKSNYTITDDDEPAANLLSNINVNQLQWFQVPICVIYLSLSTFADFWVINYSPQIGAVFSCFSCSPSSPTVNRKRNIGWPNGKNNYTEERTKHQQKYWIGFDFMLWISSWITPDCSPRNSRGDVTTQTQCLLASFCIESCTNQRNIFFTIKVS